MACDTMTVTTGATAHGVNIVCTPEGPTTIVLIGVGTSVLLALLTALTVWKTWELAKATRIAAEAARAQVETSAATLQAQTRPELAASVDTAGRSEIVVTRTATRLAWSTYVTNVGVGLATLSQAPQLHLGTVAITGEIRPQRLPPGADAAVEFIVEQRDDLWQIAFDSYSESRPFEILMRYIGALSDEQQLVLTGSKDDVSGEWCIREAAVYP